MTDKELLKKLFQLLQQAKEAGYITNEERHMMYEFARRGSKREPENMTAAQLTEATRLRDSAVQPAPMPEQPKEN